MVGGVVVGYVGYGVGLVEGCGCLVVCVVASENIRG